MRALAYKGYNWVECPMFVELAMNNAVTESTGMLPAHMTYIQSLRMPVDHLDSLHPVQVAQD